MDKQTAFEILGLDISASFIEAKKAYRRLAKKYHPDMMEIHASTVDDKKMIEINLAFFYLTPILRAKKNESEWVADQPEPLTRPTAENRKTSQNSEAGQGFSFFSILFQKVFLRVQSIKRPSGFIKKGQTRQAAPKREPRKKKSFDQVLNRVYGAAGSKTENKGTNHCHCKTRIKNNPFQGYHTYMALKNKMSAAKKRQNENISVSRVEKIDPIRPVAAVKRY